MWAAIAPHCRRCGMPVLFDRVCLRFFAIRSSNVTSFACEGGRPADAPPLHSRSPGPCVHARQLRLVVGSDFSRTSIEPLALISLNEIRGENEHSLWRDNGG